MGWKPRACSPSSWQVEGTPATCLGLMSLPFTAGREERTSGERGEDAGGGGRW